MMRAMPARAKQIILNGDFGGADLVTLDSDVHRPSFKDHIPYWLHIAKVYTREKV